MEWHDVTLPQSDCVTRLAKNAPSMDLGECLTTDKLLLLVWSLSQEKLYVRKSVSDHHSDCAPVSVCYCRYFGIDARVVVGATASPTWSEKEYGVWDPRMIL